MEESYKLFNIPVYPMVGGRKVSLVQQEQISNFFRDKFNPLFRGISSEDLEQIATFGTDRLRDGKINSDRIYVSDFKTALGFTRTALLVYDSTMLSECVNEKANHWTTWGYSYPEYKFIKNPKEALKAIIDIRIN